MAMSQDRKHEIAFRLLRHMMAERGVEVGNDFRRTVGRYAKATEVPFGEMLEFATGMVADMLAEVSDTKKPPTEDELAGHCGH